MMQMNWDVVVSSRNRKHVSLSERSKEDEKHKEHIDHDSTHDKTVASLLAQLDGVDSKLHHERIIAVQEEPNLHIVSTREMPRMECGHPGNFCVVWTYPRSSRLHVRMSKKSGSR